MLLSFKRAIRDIRANRFLSLAAIITIALSVMIVSAFTLFFINANALMEFWTREIRIMAYLKPKLSDVQIAEIQQKIEKLPNVASVRFISKKEAMKQFKAQTAHQASLWENLKENPLPDTFEIQMTVASQDWKKFEALAKELTQLSGIEDVEYGKKWLDQFANIMIIFKFAGYTLGGIFFMAAVFFVANTIRLVIYSRQEEVSIMRLVGATERFIRTPFYIQAIIQGMIGGILGLGALFAIFNLMTGEWRPRFGAAFESLYQLTPKISGFQIQFLSFEIWMGILLGSIFVGWIGCYISLRQFLRL